ncbi:hypothetical protein ACEWY4_019648 [Coilia grayii]|uniref:Uncharacterized protein n=1 Tax=Coilia grayii TaxID=363190 RepID=A0ABD1JC10_9TELE
MYLQATGISFEQYHTVTMTPTKSIGYVFQVLTLAVLVRHLYAAPLEPASCKGAMQPDGKFAFKLPDDFTDLIHNCEPELIVEDIVCAIYMNGTVPVKWNPPVVSATMHSFALGYCPRSVKIGLDCPMLWSVKYISCACDPSISSVQNQSSTTTPPTTGLSLPKTPHNGTHYRVGLAISGVVFCGALAWIALRRRNNRKRMKDIECSLRGSSAETSPPSSSDQLPGPQNSIEKAPIINHDKKGGT